MLYNFLSEGKTKLPGKEAGNILSPAKAEN